MGGRGNREVWFEDQSGRRHVARIQNNWRNNIENAEIKRKPKCKED
jgi:hypothetical protein